MATYYVDHKNGSDNNNGSSGSPWKTLNKANTACSAGDTIKIRGNKNDDTTWFSAGVQIEKANTTWEADSGHTPTIDGGYYPTYGNWATYAGDTLTGGKVSARAPGITIRNLRLQHLPTAGFGMQETASNLHITGCTVFFTYGLSLNCNSMSKNNPPQNIEIDNCYFIASSMGMHSPGIGQAAANAVMLKYLRNVHFHHNVVAYSMKEGVNIDKMCEPVVFEYNIIHTMNHSGAYLNRARDVDIRYNVFYHTRREEFLNDNDSTPEPVHIKIGDEAMNHSDDAVWGHSNRQRVYGNLVIGGSSGLTIANNAHNYDTQLDRAYIGYNTFVGTRYTRPGGVAARTDKVIEIFANQSSKHGNRAHKNTIFENNIIYAPAGVPFGTFEPQNGVHFRNNLWYSADGQSVPSAAQGNGDIVANPQMTNPTADFSDVFPAIDGGININNYKLTAGSPAIGRASDRSTVNGLTPPGVQVDLTGTTRTDYNRDQQRYYDIGALEYGGSGGGTTGTVTANFTQSGTGGAAPYTVTLTSTSTTTDSAVINSYLWDFGDGTTSSAAGPVQKTYTTAGEYRPRLTVQDTNMGLSDSKNGQWITVTGPPIPNAVNANFTQSGTGGQAPYTVTFTNTSTVTGTAVIHARTWNFGDGQTSTAGTATVEHTYSAAGTYTPTLTVQDTVLSLSDTHTGSAVTVTAAPTGTVTANFTQSGTGGEAPYIVTFTNTSTATGGAVIDEWEMRFGDGNIGYNTPFPITYIYSAAGSFTPRLIVRDTTLGLQDGKNGSVVTVTTPPTGEEPGIFDVARTQLPTTTGLKTIQLNLGGVAPALVYFILTKAATVGTAVDGATLSFGATDGVRQWCSTFNANDNKGTTDTEKLFSTSAVIVTLDNGAVTGSAALSSIGPNYAQINITDAFPAAYYLTVVAYAGPNFRGTVDTVGLGVQTSVSVLNPGFRPELWLFAGNAPAAYDAVEDQGDFSLGMANPTESAAFTWRDVHGQAAASPKSMLSNYPTVIRNTVNSARAVFSNYETNTLQILDNSFNRVYGYAALDIAGDTQTTVKHFLSPVATGYQAYTLGFRPSGALILATGLNTPDAMTTGAVGGFSLIALDAYGTYTTAISSQNADTSNTKSIVTDKFTFLKADGAVGLEGTIAITDTGIGITWTTVAINPAYFVVSAVSGASSVTGPIPDFTADDRTPDNGRVQFTDLSNPNGSPITGWIWYFGDEKTSNEQHPLHQYDDPGVYDVILTVVNANGSETRTKTAYINYQPGATWLWGNYDPLPITNASEDRLHGDDITDPLYGFIEMSLNLDGLEIDAYPEDLTTPATKPGKLRMVADFANERFVIILPDGTLRYIDWSS